MNVAQEIEAGKAIGVSTPRRESNVPFYLVLIYLMLEFGRPQEIIPGLRVLRLPGVVTALLAIALLVSGRSRLSDKQTKLFMCLLALMAAHVPFAVNNFWAFEGTRIMALTFVVYLAIVTFVDSTEKFNTLINAWIGTHIYLAINGMLSGGRGIGGFLEDENDFALALNMIIPFGFFLAVGSKGTIKRLMLLVVTGMFVVATVATFSRGGFIGLLAVGVYCWLRSPKKIRSSVLVALLILVMVQFAPGGYWESMQTIQEEIGGDVGTGGERIYSWKAGWRMFLDHPVLGVGPQNFPWSFEGYEPEEGYGGRSHGGRSAHSLYFTLLPELGIVGVLIFGGMLYCVFRDLRMVRRLGLRHEGEEAQQERARIGYLGLAAEGSLIGLLVTGTFISVLYYPNLWILMGFVVALRKAAVSAYEDNLTSH